MTRKYWKGLEELHETPEFLKSQEQEFAQQQSVEEFLADDNLSDGQTGRRDFLKFLGFSVAAATVAACEAPVTRAIPYVIKPEDVTPGMPTWYASTYYDGSSYASILVKTREGRPIFVKGNKDYGFTKGVVNAQIIASVLSLYDSSRLQDATVKGTKKGLSSVDTEVITALKSANKVTLVSNTIISPAIFRAIDEFNTSLGEGKFEHIQYDPVSYAGIRLANQESFGQAIIPDYDFSKAKTIVSVGADFLNSWVLPTQFSSQFGETRNPDGEWMSKFFAFESNMSITGSNADFRGLIKPSQQGNLLAYIAKGLGISTDVSTDLPTDVKVVADKAIVELKKTGKNSLVVAGSNNKAIQILVNAINAKLGAYTTTININNPINLFKSDDAKMNQLVQDVIAGKKANEAIIFLDTNPVYTLANGVAFKAALSKVKTTVAISQFADETAVNCEFVYPSLHALESWNDFQPKKNAYAISQPVIRPLFANAVSPIETFLVWAGTAYRGGKDSKVAYEYIRSTFDTTDDWNLAVHNSIVEVDATPAENVTIEASLNVASQLPSVSGVEVMVYQKASLGIGTQANNPWLQEMPDPLTKVTWDNYFTMNPVEMKGKYNISFDQEHGLSLATFTVNGVKMTLPVYPLPGQALGTIGVALGYGRGANGEKIGNAAFQTAEYGGYITNENGIPKPIGQNAFQFVSFVNGTYSYEAAGSITGAEGVYPIAATQIANTSMARHSIVRETTLETYKKGNKDAYNAPYTLQKIDEQGKHVAVPISEFNLWDEHPVEHIGHRWVMSIDLNQCFGCGACLIACQAENNVPVVGKDEVRRGREMHWLRLDRYFCSEEEAAIGTRKDPQDFSYTKAEKDIPVNPSVIFMPMMCHHCNHAPCETVCPVAATTHSNEGLNQMTYNRCIGTRYCANNCPYKVRRFNWFNYPSYKKFTEINPSQDDLGRMVLNPDVTVRTRGVMEKCSFCVQNIQAGKLKAKVEGRAVVDGDVSAACGDACPAGAITFGDWNDITSNVRKSADNVRSYQVLEEIGVRPNVYFSVKVRNDDNTLLDKIQEEAVASHHADDHSNH